MARWAWALALLACLVLSRARAGADTFTHKKTGRVLKGRLLGTVTKDGKTVLMIRTAKGDGRMLPAAEWEVTREPPPQLRLSEQPKWPPVSHKGKPRDGPAAGPFMW